MDFRSMRTAEGASTTQSGKRERFDQLHGGGTAAYDETHQNFWETPMISKIGQTSMLRRREVLTGLSAGVLVSAPLNANLALAAQETNLSKIHQPKEPGDKAFIARAFEMRRRAEKLGDQGYGAVVVRDGKIIGQSWSRVILDKDPTAHAEMAAIRDAARHLNNRDLSNAVLYASSRPCPMCEAAAYWAGIAEIIYGSSANKAGPPKLCR